MAALPPVSAPHRVLILYGSQTGAAKSIAESLHQQAAEYGVVTHLATLNDYKKVALDTALFMVCICSTTGNGDPPDNAEAFWRFLRRRDNAQDLYADLKYCVLALGDTNYSKFCNAGKIIDERLQKLGASPFMPIACADDATGLETVVEPWRKAMWTALAGLVASSATSTADEGWVAPGTPRIPVIVQDPFQLMRQITQAHNPYSERARLAAEETKAEPAVAVSAIAEDVMLVVGSKPVAPRIGLRRFCELIEGSVDPAHVSSGDPRCGAAAAEKGTTPLPARSIEITPVDPGTRPSLTHTDKAETAPGPVTTPVVAARYLTAPTAERRVIHMDVQVPHANWSWNPGDAVGIHCPNDATEVSALLRRLGVSGTVPVVLKPLEGDSRRQSAATSLVHALAQPCLLRDVFSHHVDIRLPPKKAMVRMCAEYCSNKTERDQLMFMCSRTGKEAYATVVENQMLTLLDLLCLFPSCHPDVAHVLSVAAPHSPRWYSIASSPLADPTQFSVAFSVVEFTSGGVQRTGLCTTWLETLLKPLLAGSTAEADRPHIPVTLRPSKGFGVPGTTNVPLILVGPGTGVAPFLGFLQHRERQVAAARERKFAVCSGMWRHGVEVRELQEDPTHLFPVAFGEIHLFFGCRKRDEDFLYADELQSHKRQGVLTELHTAFSREQEKKVYVQHRLAELGKQVSQWILGQSAYVFICGDGGQMARDVMDTLSSILQTHGGLSPEQTKDTIKDMMQRQRLVMDVWS